MRVVSRRDFTITLFGRSMRRVMNDMMLAIVYVCGVPVGLIPIKLKLFTTIPS
jgi:hypothetical protein